MMPVTLCWASLTNLTNMESPTLVVNALVVDVMVLHVVKEQLAHVGLWVAAKAFLIVPLAAIIICDGLDIISAQSDASSLILSDV